MSLMHRGLADLRVTGGELRVPYYLTLLAKSCGKASHRAEGLTLLTEALTLVDKNDERWYEAEIHRLTGQLLLQQSPDNATEAEACFHQAITIAQSQQGKSLELRAATSLAKLWQRQGKRQEAYDLLAPVYNWFTEGFDTADLKGCEGSPGRIELKPRNPPARLHFYAWTARTGHASDGWRDRLYPGSVCSFW